MSSGLRSRFFGDDDSEDDSYDVLGSSSQVVTASVSKSAKQKFLQEASDEEDEEDVPFQAIPGHQSPISKAASYSPPDGDAAPEPRLKCSSPLLDLTSDHRPAFLPPFHQVDSPLVLNPTHQVNRYISRSLLPHQTAGVRWLYAKHSAAKGAVLGDDMGMGKTLQIISLLSAIYQKSGESSDKVLCRMKQRAAWDPALLSTLTPAVDLVKANLYMMAKPSLVVVPRTLVDNWSAELARWGYFLIDVLQHDPKKTDIAEDIIQRALHGQAEIVLVSYSQLSHFYESLSAVSWEVMVLDEGHRLKNTRSKVYEQLEAIDKCQCTLLLTGTPIQNDLREFWSLLHLIHRGGFMDRKQYIQTIEKPIKLGMTSSASKTAVALATHAQLLLNEIVEDVLLRRSKELISCPPAANKDKAKPSNDQSTPNSMMLKGKEEIIVMCELSPLQMSLYAACLALPDFDNVRNYRQPCPCGTGKIRSKCCSQYSVPYQRRDSTGAGAGQRIDPRAVIWKAHHPTGQPCSSATGCPLCVLLPCLDKLLKIANHPALLQGNAGDGSSASTDFLVHALPQINMGLYKDNSIHNIYNLCEISGKIQTLQQMLEVFMKNHEKTLIFSISVEVLTVMETLCKAKGYSYCRLDGSTPAKQRQGLIDQFNSSPSILVFLLSAKSGGLGVNLTSARKVIMYDLHWNPCVDMQAQDRAYRIGQQEVVHVYRLIAKNSIEEVIYMRQLYKQQLYKLLNHKKAFKRGKFDGVEGHNKELHGELFGVHNLFLYHADSKTSILQQLREKYSNKKGKKEQRAVIAVEQECELVFASVPQPVVPSSSSANVGSSSSRRHAWDDMDTVNNQDLSDAIDLMIEEDYPEEPQDVPKIAAVSEEDDEEGMQLLQQLGINMKVRTPPVVLCLLTVLQDAWQSTLLDDEDDDQLIAMLSQELADDVADGASMKKKGGLLWQRKQSSQPTGPAAPTVKATPLARRPLLSLERVEKNREVAEELGAELLSSARKRSLPSFPSTGNSSKLLKTEQPARLPSLGLYKPTYEL